MASVPRRLLLQSRQCTSRIQSRATPKHTAQWQRPMSTTPQRCAKQEKKKAPTTPKQAPAPSEPLEQDQTDRTPSKKEMTPEEVTAAQLASLVADLKALNPEELKDSMRKGQRGMPFATDYNLETYDDFAIEEDDKRKVKAGFWSAGEESMGADEDYYGDDITSHGHGELQRHRNLREYNRLIAWEMPLLNQLAKPFTPPTAATPFRFRYTSYLGESHPATNKVVVEFNPTDLSLTPLQQSKLIKLSGPRYNPSTNVIKMSCEKFDSQTQNKRFLGETLFALIAEAKDSKDTFEDVPFDFRHHKPKPRYEFPKEWVLTEQRKKYLAEKRAGAAKLEDERKNNGRLVDGKTVIETSLPAVVAEAVEQPVMVGGPRGRQLR